MANRALRRGMDVVERTFHDLADHYGVTIAASHWVLDDSDDQCPQSLCFYVQGDGYPYCLEFMAYQLAVLADAHQGADRRTVEQLIREKIQALIR